MLEMMEMDIEEDLIKLKVVINVMMFLIQYVEPMELHIKIYAFFKNVLELELQIMDHAVFLITSYLLLNNVVVSLYLVQFVEVIMLLIRIDV